MNNTIPHSVRLVDLFFNLEKFPSQQKYITNQHTQTHTQSKEDGDYMDEDGKQPGIENQKLPSTNNATTKEYTQSREDEAETDEDGEQLPGTES